MLDDVLIVELESKAVHAVAEKHAGRLEQALAILDECEAIIKRLKELRPVEAKGLTFADTFRKNWTQNEGTNTNG